VQQSCPGVRRLVKADLSNNRNLASAMDEVLKDPKIRRLAAVIICAGISPFGAIEITPVEQLRLTFEINTVAAVTVYQKCLPLLRRARGRYILTSSMAGKVAIPFIGYYSASKFALEGLADVMRREAQQWRVSVIVVEPGSIKSAMVSNQIRRIEESLSRLHGSHKELYGHMYKRWHKIVSEGFEAALSPQYFAKAVMRALTTTRPRPRYVSDPLARKVIGAGSSLGDRALDNFIQRTMGLTVAKVRT